MAIRPMKRDRSAMMSSPTSYPRASSSSSCHPPPAGPASLADEQEEYERAVAFLAEFRSRRVASPALHATSLDAIVENDGLDDILASDFALALDVGGRGPSERLNVGTRPSPAGLSRMKKAATTECLLDLDVGEASPGLGRHSPSKPGLQGKGGRDGSFPTTRPSPTGLSGMRKAATTECLCDLDAAPSSARDPVARPVTPPTSEPDYYFGCDEESGPVAKRQRSLPSR